MKENKVVTISAQIPADLEKSLIKLCEFEERSKSYFIKKALEKLYQNNHSQLFGYIFWWDCLGTFLVKEDGGDSEFVLVFLIKSSHLRLCVGIT